MMGKMNKSRFLSLVLLAAFAGAALLSACSDGNSNAATATRTAEEQPTEHASSRDDGQVLSTEEIVRKLRPSVVQVTTEGAQLDIFGQEEQSRGVGTGVIIDDQGHIVTNNHVVRLDGSVSQRVTVTVDGERTVRAEVVGTDPQTDLAVLKINQSDLTTAELGDSASVPVGAEVVAIGYALGLEGDPTVTQGVVSAKGRVIQEQNTAINDALQTDASINPGNSGGPLVDDQGRVVGINTAIFQGAQNIGFAISIDLVKPIVDELIREGRVARGFLGILTQDITPGIAASNELPVDKGVIIAQVDATSPAGQAGLEAGDVIVRLEDTDIENSGDLLEALRRYRAGQQVTVSYYRGSRQQETQVTLGERPES